MSKEVLKGESPLSECLQLENVYFLLQLKRLGAHKIYGRNRSNLCRITFETVYFPEMNSRYNLLYRNLSTLNLGEVYCSQNIHITKLRFRLFYKNECVIYLDKMKYEFNVDNSCKLILL